MKIQSGKLICDGISFFENLPKLFFELAERLGTHRRPGRCICLSVVGG
eukprot:XP_001704213.1 Hypothetical protein GL50803_35720 [Giardia lamblia ATCC 50803]